MAIPRTAYNALVDSDGSPTSGSPWDKAAILGVLLDPIDAALGYVSLASQVAVGDNTANDRTAIQAALDLAATAGGGIVRATLGKTYRVANTGSGYDSAALTIPDDVTLDLQGATLRLHLTGLTYGVRLMNRSQIINGTVQVDSTDSLSDAEQSIAQANISVGAAYDTNGTVASPSAHEGLTGWRMANLTLSSDRVGGQMVVIYGGAHHGVIEQIAVVGDANTRVVIGADPGWLGTLSSNNPGAAKTAYNAGTMYTTHPHHITIRDITIGTMSRSGGTGDLYGCIAFRFSGCQHITVDGAEISGVTHAAVYHTASDIGHEFALADDRAHAYQGMKFRNITLDNNATAKLGAFVDTIGDNIWRAQYSQGYAPLVNPLFHGDIVFEQCQFIGTDTASTYGIRTSQAAGVTIRNCTIRNWQEGVWFDEMSSHCVAEHNIICNNTTNGVLIGFGLREATHHIRVQQNYIHGNATGGTSNGISVVRGSHHKILGNVLGALGEATQDRGLMVSGEGNITNCQIVGNHVLGAVVVGYAIEASPPPAPAIFAAVSLFCDNTAEREVPTALSGQVVLPVQIQTVGDQQLREWLTSAGAAPADGSWYRGDRLRRADPSASTSPGWDVVTSGTFGTLAGLTNASTSNSSAVVEMYLQSKTADTTQSSYTITLNSATNIRVGLKVTIGDAGITNATIVSLSGTTATLDVQATATTTGSLLLTAGVLIGEVISLNTTPAISGAVVKKINTHQVTLSVTASSTETGRTASYTTPVFKTHPALGA